jgi:ligand-binding sensor domain-containing protein/signal transduction histidine kinase
MRLRVLCCSYLAVLLYLLASSSVVLGLSSEGTAVYEHQTWRTENGLPQNSVHSIAQTRDGYLWFATEGGLARFDGLSFVVFDSENTPALRNNNIRALLEGNDGAFWIATADGLTRLQNGRFQAFTTRDGLPDNNVLSLSGDESGNLEVTTSEGIAVLENDRFVRRDAGPAILPPHLTKANVQAQLRDREGRLWMGTSDGLFLYKDGKAQTIPLRPLLHSAHISALSEDRAGVIWLGTETGAARFVDGKMYPITSPESISQGLILSFFEDREGDMWVGTDSGGVTVLRDQRFRNFGRLEGLPEELTRCVFADTNGTLWAGTNGHGLRRFDGQRFSTFTTANGLSSDVILSIGSDSKNDLLVGTPDGLNIIHDGHVKSLTSADGLPDDLIRSIYKDTDSTIWIGTRRGLAHYSAGRITTYTTADGLTSDLVGTMLRSANGCLWVGTLKGLTCVRDGKVDPGQTLSGLGQGPITSLFEDAAGVLWIGTENDGLARLGKERVFQFPSSFGLPKSISGIVEDANGQLWITSSHGLYRVSKAALNSCAQGKGGDVSVVSYGTVDGLPVNEFNTGGHPTVWRDRQNTLWFASAKGIVSIDARHTAPNRVAPLLAFERVTADDRILDPLHIGKLGPGLARVSFEYTALNFAAPHQVQFRYRLDGFDHDWIDAGSRRTAYYTNLAPGSYRFRLLARNEDGVWSGEAATLAFYLRPHIYQTRWFGLLLLALIAGTAYAFYRWRVNQVRAQFHAVIAERSRIAREIHDTLAQGLAGISVQLELIKRLMSKSIGPAEEALNRTQMLVQDSLAEARRAIWNLRSESDLNEDLPSKLSKTIRQTVQNRPLDVRLEVSGAYRQLPARIEDELLRIGREAVTNVIRHANATRLDVRLTFGATRAEMNISDDGQGFTHDERIKETAGHFGLRGMRERAEGINGKLSVTTAAGKGTQICLELPLK